MAKPPKTTKTARRRAKSTAEVVADILVAHQFTGRDGGGHDGFAQDAGGATYQYNGRFWEQISDATLSAIALEHDPTPKASRLREIRELLKARVHRRDLEFGRVADHEVPCIDGVVDVLSGQVRPHAIDDYIDSVIPWNYDGKAACADWLDTLIGWFGDADEADTRAAALQEFFGYVVLPHAKAKKALVLVGPSNCGKSIVPLVAKALVGAAFTCSLPVSDMEDPVKRWVIKHKRLNIMTELPAEAMIADGGFKTLVSAEDPIFINGKYEMPMMYVPIAKHVIATNVMPKMTDRTEATINRLLVVPFERVFGEAEQDETLLARLTAPAAMRGLFAWAVAGARRLVDRRLKFTAVAKGAALLAEMREDANPFIAFARERLVREAKAGVPLGQLVAAFNKWTGGRKADARRVAKWARDAGFEWGSVWVGRLDGGEGGKEGSSKGLRGWRLATDSEREAGWAEPLADGEGEVREGGDRKG